jgi:hypothetical protein
MKTLPETFYKKNGDFCTKMMSVFKKPNKTQKNRLEVGFFRRVFWVLLGGFFIASPGRRRVGSRVGRIVNRVGRRRKSSE